MGTSKKKNVNRRHMSFSVVEQHFWEFAGRIVGETLPEDDEIGLPALPETPSESHPENVNPVSEPSAPSTSVLDSVPETAGREESENQTDSARKKFDQGQANGFMWEETREKRQTKLSEVEIMKERFAKLLLGEDMSGGAKGVCQALAISNAITNLSASVFGEHNKLAPIHPDRLALWRREMEWLLCVTDYIVELVPAWQTSAGGALKEVMMSKQRADLHANLPALRKLDTMLLECLNKFKKPEFWYESPGSVSSIEGQQRGDKWWLPMPRVPVGGLSDEERKVVQKQKEVASQVLKAAMAINTQTLMDMDIPDAFCDNLPKSIKAHLGDSVYRLLTAENFNPGELLSVMDLSNEHATLDSANKLESAIYVWRRKVASRNTPLRDPSNRHMGESLLGGASSDSAQEYAGRAETALLMLRQKSPGLPQTSLDGYKIQYNRDVGKSILESYSRVLESFAANIVSRIEDVLRADNLQKGASSSVSSSSGVLPSVPIDIPTIVLSVGSSETSSVDVWGDPSPRQSPRHSPSRHSPSANNTPTSPVSVQSDPAMRDRIWRPRRPSGLPSGSSKKAMQELLLGPKKAPGASGMGILVRSMSESIPPKGVAGDHSA